MTRIHNRPAWDWALKGMISAPIVGLLAFTIVRYPIDLDFLLPFALVLCGIGLLATTMLRWAFRRDPTKLVLLHCAAGILFMAIGALELSPLSEGVRTAARLGLIFTLLAVVIGVIRVRTRRSA